MASFLNLIAKIIRAVVDSLAAILGLYYSTKYAAIIRRLGLPLVEPSERRGFVVLQIDGLAYIHLLEAIERGYAPYLQRLLRRGEFRLHPWRVGLPCTTPAVQAGIMFGNNDEIPAFRWYDKKAGLLIDCAQPAPVHAIQERIASLRPGILTGGSSYMNMFDGGASLSMFTLGAWNSKHFFENVKGLGFLILFLLNPFRSLKMFILAIWEYFTDLVQHTMALLKQRTPHPLQRKFRFLRVVSNVVFREIQTFAVMIDIYRGVPAIYATYYGYDEVAHHYGPLSKPALRALHAIDRRIRRIDGLRRLALTREYDLYILSDHGMTSATPFKRVFGGTLGELARDCADGCLELIDSPASMERDALQEIYLEEELRAIEANAGSFWGRIARSVRRALHKRLMRRISEVERVAVGLVVRSAGSLSHLYLAQHKKQLELREIEALAPRLVEGLAQHPSIGMLLARQDGEVILITKKGRAVLNSTSLRRALGRDPQAFPFDGLDNVHYLRRLARMKNAGDLIALGHYDPQTGTVICFEDQWACHGGIGGPQQVAFMFTEQHIDWNLEIVRDANDLYPLFAHRYGLLPSAPFKGPAEQELVAVELAGATERLL